MASTMTSLSTSTHQNSKRPRTRMAASTGAVLWRVLCAIRGKYRRSSGSACDPLSQPETSPHSLTRSYSTFDALLLSALFLLLVCADVYAQPPAGAPASPISLAQSVLEALRQSP